MSEVALDRAIGGADALRPTDVLVPAPHDGPATEPPQHHRHALDRESAIRSLPRGELSEFQRAFRHWFSRTVSKLLMKTYFRIEVIGADRLPAGPAVYCFNHLSWMDPLLLLATMRRQPRLYFYGPKQEDLRSGRRNRFMWWTGVPVPFSPLKDDLITSVRWAQAVFDSGGVLAISGEGTIHVHEGELLPFEEGVAYLALRGGVPIVPIAITGTSWAHFRGRVLVRVGEPIPTGERPTRQAIAHYAARSWHTLRAMIDADRDPPLPGRFGRWLTDVFNDWGAGGREAAELLHGPDPSEVPIPPSRRD
jgi:1-acyl-sn-glycerol-3-phosphate acyltransferase